MKISVQTIHKAAAKGIISSEQAKALTIFFEDESESSMFDLANSIYYFGGMLAIGAMTLFMTYAWERFGGFGIFGLCLCYAVIGLSLSMKFKQRHYAVPAGICATFVIALTPLAVFGLQLGFDLWPTGSHYQDFHRYIRWNWLYMELATLTVGIIMAWIYRYPFMIMPIAVTLWYLSMDLTSWLLVDNYFDWQLKAMVSMYFGLLFCLLALWVDIRGRKITADYAYWLYIFGVLTFWGGLSCQSSNSELAKFIYFAINLAMMLIGVIINRRVFTFFGSIGAAFYIGHLAFDLFKDKTWFPIVLSALGFFIIYLGTIWQKHHHKIEQRLLACLPNTLLELATKIRNH